MNQRSNPRQRLVLQNILMASLMHDGESTDCQYDIRRPSVSEEPLPWRQRPQVAAVGKTSSAGSSTGGSGGSGLECATLARQAYRAKGYRVLSQTSKIEFIGPYLAGQARPVVRGTTRAAASVSTVAEAAAASSKSPISTFPASDILATYNDSRDRLMAESKLPAFGSEAAASSLERLSKQSDANGQAPVGLHYRHREKADRAERPSAYGNGATTAGFDDDEDSAMPASVRARNQFRPNGLRSSALSSNSQQDGSGGGGGLIAAPPKQPQHPSLLMVSGISQHHAGRERDEDLTEERESAAGGDGSQALWQPATAASGGAAAAASTRVSAVQAGGPPPPGSGPRRSLNKTGSTTWRSQSHSSGGSSSFSGSSGRASKKEVEPTYADPLLGAPSSLQSRLAELSALESETVRWEKARKLKKKGRDRDD